jgi:hypothetical protein
MLQGFSPTGTGNLARRRVLEGIVFRSALIFAVSLVILTSYIVIFERVRRSAPPLWIGLALLVVTLAFRISAMILTAAAFVVSVSPAEWASHTNKDVGRFIVAAVGLCGLWAAGILLEVFCNLVWQFLGTPIKPVALWSSPYFPRRRPRATRSDGGHG